DFENAASLRFSTGETGKLEMISAQAKHKEIQLTLQQARSDLIIAQQEMMKLLNTQQEILPVDAPMIRLQSPITNPQSPITDHPFIQLSQQKVILAGYQRKVEVNKLLPDL